MAGYRNSVGEREPGNGGETDPTPEPMDASQPPEGGDRYAKYMGAPVVNRSGNQDALEMDSADNPSNKIRRTSRADCCKASEVCEIDCE